MKKIIISLLCVFSISIKATGDIEKAEKFYNMRRVGKNAVKNSKDEFLKILKSRSSTLDEKRHALERIGRLSVLEGELAPLVWGQKSQGRGEIFADCMDATDYLNPRDVGQNPEYYYWKATCMGLRAAYSKKYILANLGNFKDDIMGLIKAGKGLYPNHDGGGFFRLKAAIHLNSKEVKISGLYDPRQALSLAEQAISINPEYMMGHLLKAQALANLKQKREALTYITENINTFRRMIDNNLFQTIPNEVENTAVLQMMESFKNKINH